jgi:hypothetical protein
MLPLRDPRARADQVLIVDLLKGIRTRAIDLVAAIDDLVERIDREPPAGWVPGESNGLDAKAPPVC